MESSLVIVAPKENGSSELQEKDDLVDMDVGLAVDNGECVTVSSDLLLPSLQTTPEDEKVVGLQEIKNDESPGLDEYASDEVIAESIVVASVNGDLVTLVHDEISVDGGIISTETAEISASGNPEQSAVDILDSLTQSDVLDDNVVISDSRTMVEHSAENTASAPEKDADEPVEPEGKDLEPSSEGEVGKGDAGQKTSQSKYGGSLHGGGGGESGGKDSPKGRFAIQAELNINSRPRRSVPRRSVFEMLQGEIRLPGHSKRSSMDTGSESDREPGPSRPANSRRSRLSTSERSEGLDDTKKGRDERLQVARQGPQTKRKNLEKDEIKDSHQLYKRKYVQSPLGTNVSTIEQEAEFMVDDFGFGGTEDRIAQDSDITTNLEDDDDNLALASFRKENRQHSSDCEPSDNQNILFDESAADIGVDSESNFEDLEHGNHWHSCSSPGALESPPNILESPADQDDSHHSAATGIRKNDKSKANSQNYGDALQSDTPAAEDKKRSGAPWYLANRASYEVSNDPKTLKYRIDELLKANTELRTRLKEVEGRTSTKKFNIDFHSRKFSKVRQPVFGSSADRKSTASLGKMGAAGGAEWGTGASVFDKDMREKELTLDRKEDKLRALDVELDERASQLKAGEGRLLRSERRLKEMEKTLEHRERVLKQMETNTEKTESEGKDDGVVPSNPEQLPDQASGSADGTKLERKEHELERLRRFLSEEREKLLPKQQRLTKWETVLRKREYDLRVREQRLVCASVSKKHRISRRSDEESDSDEDGKPLKTLNTKSRISVHKRNLIMKKRKEMLSSKAFKGTAKAFGMSKIKTVASNRARPHLNALVAKKQSADGKPLKEYKLRRRC